MTLELIAPAKLNLTLEILGKREDGYHEVFSLMQAIDLNDRLILREAANEISGGLAWDLEVEVEIPDDLAARAAKLLSTRCGGRGVTFELHKGIPVGYGLGGGSTDAGAMLRGLNHLWNLDLPVQDLGSIAASLGSDVTVFLYGGTALATGRGEIIEPLPDLPPQDLTLFLPQETIEDKTKRMYAQITPADYSDAVLTTQAVEKLRAGEPLTWWDVGNAFDRHLKALAPKAASAMRVCTQAGVGVVATGAGPAFFSLMALPEIPLSLLDRLQGEFGVTARGVRTLTRAESLAVREV